VVEKGLAVDPVHHGPPDSPPSPDPPRKSPVIALVTGYVMQERQAGRMCFLPGGDPRGAVRGHPDLVPQRAHRIHLNQESLIQTGSA
jgi:hypothetical protein